MLIELFIFFNSSLMLLFSLFIFSMIIFCFIIISYKFDTSLIKTQILSSKILLGFLEVLLAELCFFEKIFEKSCDFI